ASIEPFLQGNSRYSQNRSGQCPGGQTSVEEKTFHRSKGGIGEFYDWALIDSGPFFWKRLCPCEPNVIVALLFPPGPLFVSLLFSFSLDHNSLIYIVLDSNQIPMKSKLMKRSEERRVGKDWKDRLPPNPIGTQ